MKKKIITLVSVLVLIVLICVPLCITNPSEAEMENAVSEEFKQEIKDVEAALEKELSPTIVYKDCKILY